MEKKKKEISLTEGLTIKVLEKEVFLFDTIVAGTTYIDDISMTADSLQIDDKLYFFRDANKSCDENAIKIKTEYGQHIGYVPMKDNIVFDRLMNSGNTLFAKITAIEIKDNWVKIDIKVFLKDFL